MVGGVTQVMSKKDDLNSLDWKENGKMEKSHDENVVTAQM